MAKPFIADYRVDVIEPRKPFLLAEENELELKIHVPGLSSVSIRQKRAFTAEGIDEDENEIIRSGIMDLPVLYHPDGSAYIKVIPVRLGKLKVDMDGKFKDGGVFGKSVILDVQEPERSPQKLMLEDGDTWSRNFKVIPLDKRGHNDWLKVYALYDSVEKPIRIDPQAVTFHILSKDKKPPFEISHAGIFTPHRLGNALVEVTYGGLSTMMCVIVEPSLGIDNHDTCPELYHPAEYPELTRPELKWPR